MNTKNPSIKEVSITRKQLLRLIKIMPENTGTFVSSNLVQGTPCGFVKIEIVTGGSAESVNWYNKVKNMITKNNVTGIKNVKR